MSNELVPKPTGNPLQGRQVGDKVYLQSKQFPTHVVCIACGMNVRIGEIDLHHLAHTKHRDHTLPQALEELRPLLAAGDDDG